jgi:DNA-binding MarR family transcriptional regulator
VTIQTEPGTGLLARELAAVLGGIHRAARRRVRRELGLPPLSGSQVELLRLIADRPGIGVSAAARELHLAGNSVSALVNQLSVRGYLLRETDPVDRRAARLSVSPAGAERLARWSDGRAALFTVLLEDLPPEELAAVETALPALRRIADQLAEPPADPGGEAPGPA